MTTLNTRTSEKELAHLIRRVGFGGSKKEIDSLSNKSYEDSVDYLLDNLDKNPVPVDLLRRYQIDLSDVRTVFSSGSYWMYRMAHSKFPFEEKVALFWHRVFATGQNKLIQGKVMTSQIEMFRKHGLGSFETLLIELSKDTAMIMWLDNQDNHKENINLLEKEQSDIIKKAKALSKKMHKTTPIIYVAEGFEGVAIRLRQQINENSKMLCWHHVVPEMNHNELLGWRTNVDNLSVLYLRNKSDFYRNSTRIEINQSVIKNYTENVSEIWSHGNSDLQNTLYHICLLYTSDAADE